MAKLIVVSWRDIPAQVIAKQGRQTAKVLLSDRFQHAIDRAAMRAKRGDADAYMADWKRSPPRECSNDLQAEAEREAADIETRYSDQELNQIVRQKGLHAPE